MSSAAVADRDRRTTDRQVAEAMGWTIKTMGAMSDPECGGLDVCVDCEHGPPDWAELGMEPDPDWQHNTHDSEEPCYLVNGHYWQVVPHFSTSIAAAWTLIDHMVPRGWDYELSNNGSVITCVLINEPYRSVTGTGATAEEAICQAFLAAVGEGG